MRAASPPLAAPSVNSYKRLVVGRSLSGATWAPAYITYGDNNRTAWCAFRTAASSCGCPTARAIRISPRRQSRRRPRRHERKLDPGEPNNTNLYELTPEQVIAQGIGILPQSLNEALDALEADAVLRGAIGESLAQEFIKLKRMEWVEYSRHVSTWETERYLELF